ncbi:MAG TPA: HU family DNA-binding protein, partial [Holophagaceae bacterium]|nr:HU family DNA-binding protein [Holophagaceae bacterium]
MNKTELIDAMSERAGITKAQATAALEQMVSSVSHALKQGEKVTLVGFGTFAVSTRDARMGRNPRNNQPIQITARKVARFKPGKQLADAING